MLVSIIIPTFNSLNKLKKAIQSVELINFPQDLFEVVIVDDGSTDQTLEYLAEYSKTTDLKFQFFHQSNRGPAAARNLAIRNTGGDYLLIIDSDCYVDSNIINQYLKHFPKFRLAGVGGNVFPDHSNYISKYLDYLGIWRPGIRDGEVLYLVTANAFLCKKAVLEIGGFDEDFRFPGGEEPEMCHRLRMKGFFFLYDSQATVMHDHRTTLRGMVRMFKVHGMGLRIGAEKWDEFRLTKKNIRDKIFGKSAFGMGRNLFSSGDIYNGLYFPVLEYIRNLSFLFGYLKKPKLDEGRNLQ